MGSVFKLKCTKCKYRSEWELWISHEYRAKHDTPKEIEDGLWGEELRAVKTNKNNRISQWEILLVCEECGNIKVLPSLAYKEPLVKWKLPQNISPDEVMAEMERHNKEDYTEWRKYPHRCEKCNNLMKQITNPTEDGPIHCPKCKSVLQAEWEGAS